MSPNIILGKRFTCLRAIKLNLVLDIEYTAVLNGHDYSWI